jgi:hypothetical protein
MKPSFSAGPNALVDSTGKQLMQMLLQLFMTRFFAMSKATLKSKLFALELHQVPHQIPRRILLPNPQPIAGTETKVVQATMNAVPV